MVVMLPLDATAGSPSFTAQQTRQALSVLAGPAPSGRPIGARSGVRLGTPTTTATLSGGGSTTWNVAAHSGVLDTQTAAAAGPYFYATDGSDTGSITAANASNPRIDILYVKVNDNVQDGSGLTSGQVLYLAGTAASSPVQPATPARGMAIARINVPTSGGGAPTITWIAPTFYPDTFLVQTGTLTFPSGGTITSGATYVTNAITFPIAYSTAPVYVAASITNNGGTGAMVVQSLSTVSATGVGGVRLLNATSSSTTWSGMVLAWTAVGIP